MSAQIKTFLVMAFVLIVLAYHKMELNQLSERVRILEGLAIQHEARVGILEASLEKAQRHDISISSPADTSQTTTKQ